jgi:hypothetical protein
MQTVAITTKVVSLNPAHGEVYSIQHQGRIQRGRTRRAPPLKLEKIWFFGVKSWYFTRNTPKISRFPPLGAIFLSATPLTWNPGSAPGDCIRTCRKLGAKTLVKLVTDGELADTLSGPGRYDNKTADKVKRIHLKNVNYSYFKIDHLMLMCMFYIWSYLPGTSMSTSCYMLSC